METMYDQRTQQKVVIGSYFSSQLQLVIGIETVGYQ